MKRLALASTAWVVLLAVPLGAVRLQQPPRQTQPSATQRFPVVFVVGCLIQDGDRWILTEATDPVPVTAKDVKEPDETAPLGKRKIRLIGTLGEFGIAQHKGHKVRARGLAIEGQGETRLNLTSLKHLSPTCK